MVCSYSQHLGLCIRCDELATPCQADEDGEDAIDDADGLDDANEVATTTEGICSRSFRNLSVAGRGASHASHRCFTQGGDAQLGSRILARVAEGQNWEQ